MSQQLTTAFHRLTVAATKPCLQASWHSLAGMIAGKYDLPTEIPMHQSWFFASHTLF